MNAAQRNDSPFPYSELLAYRQGTINDPQQRDEIERLIEGDARWAAHWKSLENLELEQVAAKRDGRRLADYPATDEVPDIAVEIARSGGYVLEQYLDDQPPPPWTMEQWHEVVDEDAFCRRMLRKTLAELQSKQAHLPAGELLARDWILQRYYQPQLQDARRRLGSRVMDRMLRDVLDVALRCELTREDIAELDDLRRDVVAIATAASHADAATAVPATVVDHRLLVTLAGQSDDDSVQLTRPLPGTALLASPNWLQWTTIECDSYLVSILPMSFSQPTLTKIERVTTEARLQWPSELSLEPGDRCQWSVASENAPETTLFSASFTIADQQLIDRWNTLLEKTKHHAKGITSRLAEAWAAMTFGLVDDSLEILDTAFKEAAENDERPVVTAFLRELFSRLASRLARQSDWSPVAARMANDELVKSVCQILGNADRRERGECGDCGECGLVKK